jgi:hypothetical protein
MKICVKYIRVYVMSKSLNIRTKYLLDEFCSNRRTYVVSLGNIIISLGIMISF